MPSFASSDPPPAQRGGQVRALPFQGDDAALVGGVLRGHPGAAAALYDRYASRLRGLLYRVLGPDPELDDVLQDTFVRALEALPRLKDPNALGGWMMGVAVRTAKTRLQRRGRRWWLKFLPSDELPEMQFEPVDASVRQALRVTHRVLSHLPIDERLAFTLRYAQHMTVGEVAAACEVSVSTIKRRLARGEAEFLRLARHEPALAGWMERGIA